MKPITRPDQAYFVPNLSRVMFHDEAARVVLVRVDCVSIVRPIARIVFESGAVRWAPFVTLASSYELLERKLEGFERLLMSEQAEFTL